MDNISLRTPVLDNHSINQFKQLKTIWIVLFLIVFLLIVEFITLLFFFIFTSSPERCDLYYFIMYADVTVWSIFFICRFYINWKHKMYLMARQYFEFYEIASKYIAIPFYISCVSICMLLVITCLYLQVANRNSIDMCDKNELTSPIVVVTAALSLQNALLIPWFLIYIIKVHEFNKQQNPPDTEYSSLTMPPALRDSIFSSEVGYRGRLEPVDNILEKQCDLIRYYKEANELLNKKIYDLTSQGRSAIDS